jgi:hypothetical protein
MSERLEGVKAPALYLPHRLLAYHAPAVRAKAAAPARAMYAWLADLDMAKRELQGTE